MKCRSFRARASHLLVCMSKGWEQTEQHPPTRIVTGGQLGQTRLQLPKAKVRDYTKLGQRNHCHVQDPWLGTGLVGEPRGHPGWAVVPTGEHEGRSGVAVSLGMDVDWVRGARLGQTPAPTGARENQDGCKMGWTRSPSLLSHV